MKKLYLINGTMGVGKTTVCHNLKKQLDNCVFLDGDWCWNSSPFLINDETKKIVVENICFQLNNFINSISYKNILFCWLMQYQEVIELIINKIDLSNCQLKIITLMANKEEIIVRLKNDIKMGLDQMI